LAVHQRLTQVIFHGRKPLEEMPVYYAMADAMLVTLTADPMISMTLPAKVQTYMAAGKPILGAANGVISSVIRQSKCGFCAKAEDAQGFTEVVSEFLRCEDKAALGKNARVYYETNFARNSFMDQLEMELKRQVHVEQ
jgi:glycosyltransferase involved in cell wall biosynthesis